MYYLFMGSLLCYLVGEYAASPLRPAPLVAPSLQAGLIRFGVSALVHVGVLGLAFGYWGLALAAALVAFHTVVDFLTRLLFKAVSGRRVMLTLLDLALHIVCMYAASVLLSLFVTGVGYLAGTALRYGAMAATGALLFPALSKTLLVDGFPRFYAERPLFTLPEWLADALCGLLVGLLCLLLPAVWMALAGALLLAVGYFFISDRMQPGRPVLALAKIGVLLMLLPCFLLVFRL